MSNRDIQRNLFLIAFESVITAGVLCIPFMTLFYNSIAMNQEMIAFSQMLFTLFMMFFNIPAGWIADRFSRKWANVIGDFGTALAFLLYSTANSFMMVVLAEALSGIFMSLSSGVDSTLLRHFCRKRDQSGELYRSNAARISTLQYVAFLILILLGGPLGAISFRLAIAASAVPFALGALASLFIQDDSELLVPEKKNPFADILRVIASSIKNPPLRLRIWAYAVARESTHAVIWIYTPLLLLAGVPLEIVSLGWALNTLANTIGSWLAQRLQRRMKEWQIFLFALLLPVIGLGVISIHLNLLTVWFYLLMGVTQGWTNATMLPLVQKYTKPSEETSVISLTRSVGQLLYLPTVWLVNKVADINIFYGIYASLVVFFLLGLPILLSLWRQRS
ncbi:MAG: MFS transporter [Erysipelotrichaceae bacterium]|jgi:MFS family permease|nr:MFS transporter [Erysipelotrichaceae bacterium]